MILTMNSHEQQKHGYKYRREDRYNVIVYCSIEISHKEFREHWLKYHGIMVDRPASLERFKTFIRGQYPSAKYFNVYGGISGDFYKRIYL